MSIDAREPQAAPAARRQPRRTPPPSRHGPIAQLLIAWSPLSLILVVYAVAGWISGPIHSGEVGARANRLGFDLNVMGPADADRWLFGTLPSAWLQQQLHAGPPHWYDAVAAVVYVTHFVTIPLLTAVVWFAFRERFRLWLATVIAFTVIGISGYVVYPAAPPWLTFRGDPSEPVLRLSTVGWDRLHLAPLEDLMRGAQGISNPVAAMPSLHAGAALLVALFLWPSARRRWRIALLGYALLMGLSLVYTGEHYVVDVLAGWATAVAAVLVGRGVTALARAVRGLPLRPAPGPRALAPRPR